MGVGNYVHVISDIGNFRWRARAPGNGPIIGGRLVSAVLVTLRWWEVVRGGIGRGAPGYRGAWYAGIDDGWWRGGAAPRCLGRGLSEAELRARRQKERRRQEVNVGRGSRQI
jgi:hypothetical protein